MSTCHKTYLNPLIHFGTIRQIFEGSDVFLWSVEGYFSFNILTQCGKSYKDDTIWVNPRICAHDGKGPKMYEPKFHDNPSTAV